MDSVEKLIDFEYLDSFLSDANGIEFNVHSLSGLNKTLPLKIMDTNVSVAKTTKIRKVAKSDQLDNPIYDNNSTKLKRKQAAQNKLRLKDINTYPKVYVPKIPKTDIRRSYASMFLELFNSQDLLLMESFHQQYTTNDFTMYHRCEDEVAHQNSTISKGSESAYYFSVHGHKNMSAFWYIKSNSSPDLCLQFESTQFHARADGSTKVICPFVIQGTKLYELPFLQYVKCEEDTPEMSSVQSDPDPASISMSNDKFDLLNADTDGAGEWSDLMDLLDFPALDEFDELSKMCSMDTTDHSRNSDNSEVTTSITNSPFSTSTSRGNSIGEQFSDEISDSNKRSKKEVSDPSSLVSKEIIIIPPNPPKKKGAPKLEFGDFFQNYQPTFNIFPKTNPPKIYVSGMFTLNIDANKKIYSMEFNGLARTGLPYENKPRCI